MKKAVSFTLAILTILCLICSSGCGLYRLHNYNLSQEQNQINSIEIVSIKYAGVESNKSEEIMICEIENISDFLEDFSEINCKLKHPPARSYLFRRQTAVKITYHNGEYEWISPIGKAIFQHNENGNLLPVFDGRKTLDAVQFADLISKHIATDNVKLEYNFLNKSTEISAIEIVQLGNFSDENFIPEQQTVIATVVEISEFLEKFSEIDCYLNLKQPTRVRDQSIAIKISYKEGDYELIDAFGQSTSYYEEDTTFDGYRYFDEAQFSNLISEYMNK